MVNEHYLSIWEWPSLLPELLWKSKNYSKYLFCTNSGANIQMDIKVLLFFVIFQHKEREYKKNQGIIRVGETYKEEENGKPVGKICTNSHGELFVLRVNKCCLDGKEEEEEAQREGLWKIAFHTVFILGINEQLPNVFTFKKNKVFTTTFLDIYFSVLKNYNLYKLV